MHEYPIFKHLCQFSELIDGNGCLVKAPTANPLLPPGSFPFKDSNVQVMNDHLRRE